MFDIYNIIFNSCIEKSGNKIYMIYRPSEKYYNSQKYLVRVWFNKWLIYFIKVNIILLTKFLYNFSSLVPNNLTIEILFCLKYLFIFQYYLISNAKNQFSDIINIYKVEFIIIARVLFSGMEFCHSFIISTRICNFTLISK